MTGEACPIPRTSDVFTIGDQIGSGSFSNVYKAVDNKTQKTIAIKAYRMKTKDPGHFSRAAKEMAFIRFLQHPNIIGYILSDIKTYYMYLGIEYSPYGSLANFMEKRNGFTEVTVKNVTKQLVSALCYLHSILADVILKNDTHHKKSGSFYYMAPEIHLGFPSDHTG
ncbi:hypothetical protein NQ318_009363 [Aromia moschata]|uniref:Protein kinase domain-containing protein n=1 Tax=Aromia moschata TaxID=1265417 RepID=A0AAV8XEW2_9CUCU|nr:hypothetical protein NQ318_009363 [Aromia moschata]